MAAPVISKRINSIDVLRGMVMVVMALDHVRDFFSGFRYEPTDMQHTTVALFATRWITHFCAPVFIFLSGTSAYLSMGKGKTLRQQSRQLVTRGLWLILLEVTVVRLGWAFDVNYSLVMLQVIWAIGISMLALSALIYLPHPAILTIGLAMIFGHDLLDGYQPAAGAMAVLWDFLHVQGPVGYGHGNTIFIIYPLIPWVGVMAVGFCFGAVYTEKKHRRHEWLYLVGVTAMVVFVVMRMVNGYGDPAPWQPQATWWHTVLSFLNCSKYPPSLLYLLMTLGPAITILGGLSSAEDRRAKDRHAIEQAWRERSGSVPPSQGHDAKDPPSQGYDPQSKQTLAERFFTVYGRVPLFYYILHIYLIHGLAVLSSLIVKGNTVHGFFSHPGYRLPVVYAVWIAVVLILYLPCRWFMRVKERHKKWWLSYL